MSVTQEIYEEHHSKHREQGFSVLKKDRGEMFSNIIGRGKTVLDLGCRDGALSHYFLDGNTVLGVDIDSISLARARDMGINTQIMDLYGDWGEIGEKKFDVIVAGEVLEHLFFPEKIVKKVSKHLKEGGIFIGSVPNAFSLKNRIRYLFGTKRNTPLSDPTHVNHFSVRDLRFLLSQNFEEVAIYGLGRHKMIANLYPNLLAFDLVFLASNN